MPGRFLSRTAIDQINQRVAAGQQPWADAHARLIEMADTRLAQEPPSLLDAGLGRFFRVDSTYIANRDGVDDDKANKACQGLFQQVSLGSLDLALAWRFTHDARYAEKALEMIHTWCINRNTFMEPTGRVMGPATPGFAANGDISLFGPGGRLFLAMHLLADYDGWDLYAYAAVRRWVRAMVDPQREVMFFAGREMYNNWEEARLFYLVNGAMCLDDMDLLIDVFERWRHILPLKMTDEGELPRETMRTRSMHYTLFALTTGTFVAEVADRHGVDLYDYTVGGRSQKVAVDYAARYLMNMDEWPHPMICPLVEDRGGSVAWCGLFEMAHAHWGDPTYLDIIAAYDGRPVTAMHATLLYAKA